VSRLCTYIRRVSASVSVASATPVHIFFCNEAYDLEMPVPVGLLLSLFLSSCRPWR
jgi:hypothetical protein